MDEAIREFFHKALQKVAPTLLQEGREKLINGLLIDMFDHPWTDDELKKSILGNIGRSLNLPVPADWQEEDGGGEYLYDNAEECQEAEQHLTSCDEDGFCNLCGEQ